MEVTKLLARRAASLCSSPILHQSLSEMLKSNQITGDLDRNHFTAGKNPELVFGLVFGLTCSGSSHSKELGTCSESSAEAPRSPPCAVAQVRNNISVLYYQLHIMFYKHKQLGKMGGEGVLMRLEFVSMKFGANHKKITFFSLFWAEKRRFNRPHIHNSTYSCGAQMLV